MARKKVRGRFLLCASNADYPASLEVRKLYQALPDPKAEAAGFIRVIDESGEDYLYPQSLFVDVELPDAAAEVVMAAGAR